MVFNDQLQSILMAHITWDGMILADENEKPKTMSTQKNLSLLVAGAATGAVLALLLAPSSGKKTRKKLMKQCESVKDTLVYGMLKAEDEVGHLRDKVGKKAADAAEQMG